ncbi:putative amidoligase domain-containing protein [Paenibacillus thermotolerans]|uniref:putative amidoligase domain-containing protein n=1 Tax=Paenibacillus thermotolerans TaxID=3027807 RepID=UPI0023680990|nr:MULTISPECIES: hypothetical protein [unclassified Paenibacillus]
MDVFLLHAGQPGVRRLLDRVGVANGRRPPGARDGRTLYVLRWLEGSGAAEEEEGGTPSWNGVRVLQPASAVRLASDRKAREAALKRNGVNLFRPVQGSSGIRRQFVVPVFQLESLGVFSQGGPLGAIKRLHSASDPELSEWNGGQTSRSLSGSRAEREAIKAVYSLGLDYGIVTIVSDETGAAAVADVNPYPPSEEEFVDRFAAAIGRLQEGLARERQQSAPILLGTDPEFVLRRKGADGKIVMASHFLERKGSAGCDSIRIGDRLIYPLAELRPAPAAEPSELFRNLYAAMKLAAEKIDDATIEWLAGGMPSGGLALGGHIHVSGLWLHSDLLRAMDNYVALPLVLLEDVTTKRRRPRYGALGDFRRQFHGGFEYRTLPSWIVTPVLAMGVLALARTVCDHYRELGQRPLERADLQEAYYRGDRELLKEAALRLWRELERTNGYARYGKYLNKLKRKLENGERWNEQSDVRLAWKLPPYRV